MNGEIVQVTCAQTVIKFYFLFLTFSNETNVFRLKTFKQSETPPILFIFSLKELNKLPHFRTFFYLIPFTHVGERNEVESPGQRKVSKTVGTNEKRAPHALLPTPKGGQPCGTNDII